MEAAIHLLYVTVYQDIDSGYSCECEPGWIGINCSENIECGGELTSAYGTINSPGYPGNYPPNRDCYWIISTKPGFFITFAFGLLNLEHDDNCNQDYLEIQDGLLSQAPLLGKYCNTGLPPPLQTTGPYAWVHFHSNSFDNERGFLITYITSPVDPNCGGNYTDSSGVIMSPYWPNSYLNNRQCVYIIRQPPNEKIYLNFTHLELERHPNCSRNYIEIRDGDTEKAPLINKFCGSMLPHAITSNQSSLWIKFKSDTSVNTSNFRANYAVACGGSLFGEGVIRSPYFTRSLPKGYVCEWIISEPEDNIVILKFTNFHIYNDTTCNSDYVEIRNGGNATSPSLGKYCGKIMPPVVHSRHNSLYIKFSASSATNLGFMAEYKPFNIVCSHEYTTESGVLTSPNYPNKYDNKMVCIYKINVPNNQQIALHFTNFSLEDDVMCRNDYLEIRNGGFETSPLLGKYCGSSLPPVTVSHSNNLWIKFVSDMFSTSTGFSASWDGTSTGCGGILTSSGIFMSPNYPMPYYQNAECYWLLKANPGSVLEIYFDQFHLEPHPSCSFDYLTVYDGNSSNSNMLGNFSGNQILPPLRSTGNNMYIKLRTGDSLNGRGFLAHFKQVCEGIIIVNHSQGILESLNYPNNYPPGVYCDWTIQTTTGNTLNYSFQALSTKGGNKCERDHLKLYDGPNAQSTLIDTFCGDTVPPSGGTTNSSLHVVFFSDQINESTGFQMLWKVNDPTKAPPRS
ncbi:cubilin [Erythrolamprus reginae]|uniref:cubilin n=1 Tax=Erythrolamprus reginae TaxID=121349 RepID=UPI00396CD901